MTYINLYSKIQCAYDQHCEEYNEVPKEIVFSKKTADEYFGKMVPEKIYGMSIVIDSMNHSNRDQEELFYIKGSTTF